MTSLEFRDRLARRARRAKAPLTIAMLDPLEAYIRLLAQWNAKINLTALPLDPPTDETFDRLLVEPLAASKRVEDKPVKWMDLGSGGGSPAIPLKVARPALLLTMVESRDRKSAFLREATRVLGLSDAGVLTSRFEELMRDGRCCNAWDLITVRAVKANAELYAVAAGLLRQGGKLLMFRPPHSPSSVPLEFRQLETVQLIDDPPSYLTALVRH